MKKNIPLILGALAPSLSTQIKAQKKLYDKETIKHFQLDANAISRLGIRDILSGLAKDKAYHTLAKKITAHVNKMNSSKAKNK